MYFLVLKTAQGSEENTKFELMHSSIICVDLIFSNYTPFEKIVFDKKWCLCVCMLIQLSEELSEHS